MTIRRLRRAHYRKRPPPTRKLVRRKSRTKPHTNCTKSIRITRAVRMPRAERIEVKRNRSIRWLVRPQLWHLPAGLRLEVGRENPRRLSPPTPDRPYARPDS